MIREDADHAAGRWTGQPPEPTAVSQEDSIPPRHGGAKGPLSLAEVAASVGYSTKTITRHMAQGLLLGYRAGRGGHWRFSRAALVAYQQRLHQAADAPAEFAALDFFITSSITPTRGRSP